MNKRSFILHCVNFISRTLSIEKANNTIKELNEKHELVSDAKNKHEVEEEEEQTVNGEEVKQEENLSQPIETNEKELIGERKIPIVFRENLKKHSCFTFSQENENIMTEVGEFLIHFLLEIEF